MKRFARAQGNRKGFLIALRASLEKPLAALRRVKMQKTPEYSSKLFVDRDDAIAIVKDKVLKIWRGENEPERAVIFRGYRGAGKSWLLQHLAKTVLPPIPGVCPIYVNLEDFKDNLAEGAIRAVIDKIRNAASICMGSALPRSAVRSRLDDVAHSLTDTIDHLSTTQVIVLLVDHVFEAKADLLELLEKYVLGLLVTKNRVVLVMAGRGQAYRWKNVALWLEGKDVELKPFDQEAYTREQLEKLEQDKKYEKLVRGAAAHATEIHQKTGGYPLSNVFYDPQPSVRAMKRLMDLLLQPLESVRREDGSLPEREHLQALCVLPTFDEERIPVILDAYNGPKVIRAKAEFDAYINPRGICAPGWTEAKVREILQGLVKTRLVEWNERSGGWWIVDQAIRELLEDYLCLADPGRFACCHQTAIHLYADWQARYPQEKTRWNGEIARHTSRRALVP